MFRRESTRCVHLTSDNSRESRGVLTPKFRSLIEILLEIHKYINEEEKKGTKSSIMQGSPLMAARPVFGFPSSVMHKNPWSKRWLVFVIQPYNPAVC